MLHAVQKVILVSILLSGVMVTCSGKMFSGKMFVTKGKTLLLCHSISFFNYVQKLFNNLCF